MEVDKEISIVSVPNGGTFSRFLTKTFSPTFYHIMTLIKDLTNELERAVDEEDEGPLDDGQVQEDEDDAMLDLKIIINEMKEAAQEAISKSTIQAYKRYIYRLLFT